MYPMVLIFIFIVHVSFSWIFWYHLSLINGVHQCYCDILKRHVLEPIRYEELYGWYWDFRLLTKKTLLVKHTFINTMVYINVHMNNKCSLRTHVAYVGIIGHFTEYTFIACACFSPLILTSSSE